MSINDLTLSYTHGLWEGSGGAIDTSFRGTENQKGARTFLKCPIDVLFWFSLSLYFFYLENGGVGEPPPISPVNNPILSSDQNMTFNISVRVLSRDLNISLRPNRAGVDMCTEMIIGLIWKISSYPRQIDFWRDK